MQDFAAKMLPPFKKKRARNVPVPQRTQRQAPGFAQKEGKREEYRGGAHQFTSAGAQSKHHTTMLLIRNSSRVRVHV